MDPSYTTITSKGQITLPVAARHALNLKPGQRVTVRVEGNRLVIDPPRDVAEVRALLRDEAQRNGTWDARPAGGEGWVAQAEARRAES